MIRVPRIREKPTYLLQILMMLVQCYSKALLNNAYAFQLVRLIPMIWDVGSGVSSRTDRCVSELANCSTAVLLTTKRQGLHDPNWQTIH